MQFLADTSVSQEARDQRARYGVKLIGSFEPVAMS
jgi:hypothetical protein